MSKSANIHKFNTEAVNGIDVSLHFLWLTDRAGNINGFAVHADHDAGHVNIVENLFAADEESFLTVYPTLEHILKALSTNPAWSSHSTNETIYISEIHNNCGLYELPENAPFIIYGGDKATAIAEPDTNYYPLVLEGLSGEEGNNGEYNKELYHAYDYSKLQNQYDDILGLSVTFLRSALRDGTPNGFWVETKHDGDVVLVDMLYYPSEAEFLKQYPNPKALVKELSTCPLWCDMDEEQEDGEQAVFFIDFISLNEGMYKLTKVAPRTV